jgi:hypothetical protein
MATSIPWSFRAFPVALTIHDLEAGLWLPEFSKTADVRFR